MFRISKDQVTVIEVAQVEEIEPAIRANPPGRYDIDEVELNPLQSGPTRGHWAIAFRRKDGSVVIKWDSWNQVT
jgi:hypothetical protein